MQPEIQVVDRSTPLNKGSWSQHGDHEHGVQFYSHDKFLLEELSGYVGNALRAGDAAIVVSTEQHREALLQWLTAQGVALAPLIEQGRFIALDARQTLDTFIVDGSLNERRFSEIIGGIIARATASARASVLG